MHCIKKYLYFHCYAMQYYKLYSIWNLLHLMNVFFNFQCILMLKEYDTWWI